MEFKVNTRFIHCKNKHLTLYSITVFGKIWVVAEDPMTGLEVRDGKVTIVDKFFGYSLH